MMDFGTIAKVALAIVGIITAGKVFFDILIGKKSNLREEYEFAKRFLDEKDKKSLHPFTLNKGYQAIAGTDTVKSYEIEYILSLKDPVQCLSDFILSRQLFERLDTEGDFKLVFQKKYEKPFSRWWRKVWYLMLYVTLSFAALSPVLLSKSLDVEATNFLLQLLFTLPVFGLYAWIALQAYAKLARGDFLFKNQRQHTSNIISKA